jgi:hypothetical protein
LAHETYAGTRTNDTCSPPNLLEGQPIKPPSIACDYIAEERRPVGFIIAHCLRSSMPGRMEIWSLSASYLSSLARAL